MKAASKSSRYPLLSNPSRFSHLSQRYSDLPERHKPRKTPAQGIFKNRLAEQRTSIKTRLRSTENAIVILTRPSENLGKVLLSALLLRLILDQIGFVVFNITADVLQQIELFHNP